MILQELEDPALVGYKGKKERKGKLSPPLPSFFPTCSLSVSRCLNPHLHIIPPSFPYPLSLSAEMADYVRHTVAQLYTQMGFGQVL